MRRLYLWILVLVIAAPLVGLAIVSRTGIVPLAKGAAATLTALAPPAASAQSTLEFKPVPAESLPALERERASRQRRVRAPAAPVVPSVPEATIPPVPSPEPPLPPEPVVRIGNLTRVGSDIHVEKDEVVRGDVTAIRGDITVDGTVNGSVVSFGGNVYLSSTARVDGDVVCIGGELREDPGAYVSGERVTALGGRGEELARRLRRGHVGRVRVVDTGDFGDVVRAMMRFLVALGLTWLVAWLFQSRIAAGAEIMKRQPALSLGIGALVHALVIPSVIALALVVALLCITIIGIPLALAAVLGYGLFFVVFWLFGLVIGAAVLGGWLAAKRGTATLTLLQTAMLGVLIVGGVRFFGDVLRVAGWGLGGLFYFLSGLVMVVLGVMGGGAWLKWEFESGIFGHWWGRARSGNGWRRPGGPVPASPYGPPPASPYGPPVATAPPPPPPPAAPESYMPPAPEPPAAPAPPPGQDPTPGA